MAALTMLLVALQLAGLAYGKPNLAFPLNAQLPLAARLDTFFTYSFSPQTFISSSNITYSFGKNHPSWLSIESATRRLYGTPKAADIPDGDVVGQEVDIVATDATGSTTMDSTLVISRKPAPAIQIPLQDQIKTFGNFSAPSSVLSYPSASFRYAFNPDTFGKNSGLNYYAVSSDNSPLPAWIQFDAASMTFSGTTPPFESLVQPPQTFGFILVASDIVGFAATSLAFNIVVGSHKITTKNPIVTINATRGNAVDYDGLENAIDLDGKPAKLSDLDVTTEGMPQWLNYDKDTGKLSGTPRDGDHASNFTITYSSVLSATLDVLVVVNVATGLFQSTFEDMEARPGGKFDVDLGQYFKDPSDIDLNVTTNPTEQWLKVDGFKLFGNVPKDAKGSFDVTVDASSKSSTLSESEKLHVSFLAPDGTPTSTSVTTSSPSSTSTSTSTNQPSESPIPGMGGRLSTGDILLATIIPILFIALMLMLFVCFLRRRRASRSYLSSKAQSNAINPISNLRHGSDSSKRRVEKMTVVLNNEKHMLKPTSAAYVEAVPRTSTARRSSETLGGIEEDYEAISARPRTGAGQSSALRSISPSGSNDGRRSWETVEGDVPYMSGAKSMHNGGPPSPNPSIPDSTHQVFPTGSYMRATGSAGYKKDTHGIAGTRKPSTKKASTVAYTPVYGRRDQKSADTYSTKTTSSVALPINERGRNPRPFASTIAESEASNPNWETVTVSDASKMDLRPPEQAYLTAGPSVDGFGWVDLNSDGGSRGLRSTPSFGSAENWRVISKLDPTTTTLFKDNVEGTPFSPASGSHRHDAMSGEPSSHTAAQQASKWGEVGAEKKTTIHESASVLSTAASGASGLAWLKSNSGKLSTGSSFKVFI
ncbi:Cadherin-like protein [Cordyceps fumosorosea ARSEF 2679]|uniref:Cadherin-like protein n=1 Tax=Cordyceps fumosorosea (strain ARSEF 2679) TaxID=1081104 RepID=A0A167VUL8_CORFA|nr:Cadherin-like protein [Cordyceps fumosorosea ARSEF 2679]OAA62995.1 Cadherin-like protein [Cordyceps fumosorosea ARSEF 2679]